MESNIEIKTSRLPDSALERDSWKVMFDHLTTDLGRLFEKESNLIRTEVREKISGIKDGAASLAVGGALLLVGMFGFVATAIIVLNLFMALWAAAAIVTVFLFVAGGIFLLTAKKKLDSEKLKPRESIETLTEIKNTFKERINEFKLHH